MTEALTSNYWISPNAVRITLNAMGKKDYIQCGAAGGAVIMCYIRDVDGLGYDAGHNYRRWPIVTAPVYFNSWTRKYVYIAIPRSTAVGTSAILVFPSERIDLYGMTEPAEGETEGEQIGSKDYYYIFLRGVISPSRSDDGADQLREWEKYVDYGTLSTDQQVSEGDSEWWRYNADDDTVTFLKVITNATFKVLNVLKNLTVGGDGSFGGSLSVAKDAVVGGTLDVKGQATIDNIKSHNYTGDTIADTGWSITNSYNGHSKLTIDEIYVRMKAVFESLEVRERTYTGGDQIWSCAGNYVHRTDYMTDTPKTVWVEADGTERTDEAETDAEKAAAARRAQDIMDEEGIELYEVPVAGNTVGYSMIKVPWLLKGMALVLGKNNGLVRGLFSHYKKVRITMHRSPAHGGTGDESDEQVLATVRRVRCYFLAKDNERQVHNWWRINDLARCQTMNLENVVRETYLESATSKTGNVFWWRKVIGVSTNPVRLDDGKWYHYFDVAFNSKIEESTDPSIHASMATFAMEGSDIPAAGDSVVQFGNTIIEGRMNLMMMEVNGGDSIGYSPSTDAPCLKAYRGIYCFDLNKCWVGGSPCKMKLSPSTGYEFYGPNIKFVTEYAIVPVPIERPEIYWTNIGRRKDAMGNWIDSWVFEEDAYNRAEPTPYSDDAKTHRDYSSFVNPDGSVRAGAPVRKCYYYEKVSHNGCYFICSIVDGAHWEAEETFEFNGVTYPANRWINDGTYNSFSPECQGKCKRVPNYTIEEPSAESQDWTMTVNRGSEPIAVYKWAQEGTSISAPTINKAQWAAWTDGSQPIDGWTKTAPNRPTQNPETWYLFMSQNTLYADGSISTWSTPTRISGSQGTPGEDAGDTEWIYLINNSSVNPGAPNNITNGTIPDPNNPGQRIPSTDKTKDDWVPNGWTDNPDGIAWNQQYEWASFRTKAKGANVDPNIRWSDFSVPIIWSHWGQNGMDGDGVEYVYMRTKNNVAPIVAYNDNINRTAHGKTYLDDEYLPVISNNDATKSDATKAWAESNECTDDPKGISRDWPYEWCLKRVMTPANAETGKRTWRCYGGTAAGQTQEMDLWNHYAENAISLDLDNEMDSVQTDSQGKILSAREVSTVIRLWDGATEVDISAVDFTASGRISGSPASTVATFSQAASGKGKQLKWTFIAEQSMPTAYEITISYVYLNETHRCTLTIAASMGQPVYQLKPSRSSLPCTVNSSNVYNNPPALSLSVVKVDGASTDEITTIGSGGTIESGTIFIRYSLDSMPTGKTAGSAWPTANSVQATSDKENVYIAMFNAAGTLLDRETVPIVKDGKNGENAVRLDLDNQADLISLDAEGKVRFARTITTKARIYDGGSVAKSGVAKASTLTAAKLRYGNTTTGCTPTISAVDANGVVTITWEFTKGMIPVVEPKTISLTYKNETYDAVFSLGTTDRDVIYQVLPNPDKVSFSKSSSNALSPASVSLACDYTKDTGSGTIQTITNVDKSKIDDNNYLYYRIKNSNGNWGSWTAYTGAITVLNSTTDTDYEFAISTAATAASVTDSNIYEREVVPIVKDGLDGKSITKSSADTYKYKVSDDGTTTPSGTWYSTKQAAIDAYNTAHSISGHDWKQGTFMWTETTIHWSNNTETILYTNERNSVDGKAGQDIVVDGATVMKYSCKDSNTVDPTTINDWDDYNQVTKRKGWWLWSKATTWYRKADSAADSHDAGSSINYNVSYIAEDGTSVIYDSEKSSVNYAVSSMGVPETGRDYPSDITSWSPTMPAVQKGKFLWTRDITAYKNSDGTSAGSTTTYGVSYWGTDGSSVTIDSSKTKTEYGVSTQGTDSSQVTEWGVSIPTVPQGQYLWTKVTTAYSDGKSTVAYSVSYNSTDGDDVQIDSNRTFVKYCKQTSAEHDTMISQGKTHPDDNSFATAFPSSLSQGDYLWTLSQVAYVGDSNVYKSYSVSRMGTDGTNGTNGINGKTTHFAYAKMKAGQAIPSTGKITTAMVDQWSRTNFAGADAVGTYNDTTIEDSTNIADYIWTEWKGEDGSSVEIDTARTFVKYCKQTKSDHDAMIAQGNSHPDDSSFVTSFPSSLSQGDYLWTLNQVAYVGDTNTYKSYTVSMLGTDGATGDRGPDGFTTHFAYATSADGSQGFSRTNFNGATYIGTYRDDSPDDSTDYHDYTWTQWKGTDADVWTIGSDGYWYKNGVKQSTKAEGKDGTGVEIKGGVNHYNDLQNVSAQYGDCYIVNDDSDTTHGGHLYFYQGGTWPNNWRDLGKIKGEPGTDGTTYYTHYAYADTINLTANPITGSGFSVDSNGSKAWMGLCVDTNQYDPGSSQRPVSNPYAEYEWNEVKGDKGDRGADGRAITSASEHYKVSNNDGSAGHQEAKPIADGQENASLEWETDPNAAIASWGENARYLWNYEKTGYSSGTTPVRTTPRIIAIWTEDGANGKGIDHITNYYKASAKTGIGTDVESYPTTDAEWAAWDDNPVAPTSQNPYLWNFEVIYWVDPTNTTHTTPHVIGHYGEDAEIVTVYQEAESTPAKPTGSTIPPTGWSLTEPRVGYNATEKMDELRLVNTDTDVHTLSRKFIVINKTSAAVKLNIKLVLGGTVYGSSEGVAVYDGNTKVAEQAGRTGTKDNVSTEIDPNAKKVYEVRLTRSGGYSAHTIYGCFAFTGGGMNISPMYVWQSHAVFHGTTLSDDGWSDPVTYTAKNGDNPDTEKDEYVYVRTTENVTPTITGTSTEDEYLPNAKVSSGRIKGNNGTEAGANTNVQCTDDPQGINGTWKYEWQIHRVKTNGVWGAFGDIKIYQSLGEQGPSGDNAYVVVPENLIINQNLDGSMPTTDDVLFKVKSGGNEWNGTIASVETITDYLPTLPSGATGLSEHHSQASISSGKLKITSIGYYSYTYGGKTITSYYDHVSFALTVTANGVTVSHIFHVYINLLGSFKTTIEGDIEESIATKTYYVYDKDGNVVGSQTIGDYIRSSSENTARMSETVTNLSTANADNLFGFTKGVRLANSDWPVLPYIQGYGFEVYQAYSGTTRGRIQNLGFNGVEGSYVLSCEIKASQVVSGEVFTIDLCDKTPASVISGLNSDGKYEPSANEWTRVIAVFNLTRETISDFDSYVGEKGFNGFIDAESNKNSGTHLYIRKIQIERGTIPSVFCICKDDAEYASQHDHEYVKNTSNVELDDTNKWSANPNTGGRFAATGGTWNGMAIYRNSAPLTNSSGAADGDFRIMELAAGGLKMAAGTPYTLSFWARSSSSNLKMRSFLVCGNTGGLASEEPSVMEYMQSASTNADGYTRTTLDDYWRKYYVHYYVQKNKTSDTEGYATAYGIRISTADLTETQRTSNNFYYYICGLKLEKGYITSDDRMNYETVVHQTSRSIDMSVLVNAVKKAGIELTTNQEGDVTTGVIKATADKFEIRNSNGDKTFEIGQDGSIVGAGNAKFNGKIEATGGKIGGFDIGQKELTNTDWQAGIDIKVVDANNKGKTVKIGENAKGEMDTENAIMRAENTEVGHEYNTALYLNAKNAAYNYAFYGNGNGVLNGYMQGYKAKIHSITNLNSPLGLNLGDGRVQVIDSITWTKSDMPEVNLPTLGEVRRTLGIGQNNNINFCCELVIINQTCVPEYPTAPVSSVRIWGKRSGNYDDTTTNESSRPLIVRAYSYGGSPTLNVQLDSFEIITFHITYVGQRFLANYIIG